MPLTERIFMVISDIEMPEMDGYTFTTRSTRGLAYERIACSVAYLVKWCI